MEQGNDPEARDHCVTDWGKTYDRFIDLVENSPGIYAPGGRFRKERILRELQDLLIPAKSANQRARLAERDPGEQRKSLSNDYNYLIYVYRLSKANPGIGAWARASLSHQTLPDGRSRPLKVLEVKALADALREDTEGTLYPLGTGPCFAAAIRRIADRD